MRQNNQDDYRMADDFVVDELFRIKEKVKNLPFAKFVVRLWEQSKSV
jgi:hypothetical protein